jgi:hypothetical protein
MANPAASRAIRPKAIYQNCRANEVTTEIRSVWEDSDATRDSVQ